MRPACFFKAKVSGPGEQVMQDGEPQSSPDLNKHKYPADQSTEKRKIMQLPIGLVLVGIQIILQVPLDGIPDFH